ncbi:MAG: hypothetical protein HY840_15985 [Bacteroidetes bacterium]|nr:hypothetical protein [Bacteroidota bacterium]
MIVEAIHQHNEYSLVSEVSANLIGNYLYLRDNKIISHVNDYNNFKRKVRSLINKLEKRGFIIRKSEGKPNYQINNSFERKNSIFDNQ